MSLAGMLRSTGTLQRPTSTKDGSAGRSVTWADVAGAAGVACDVQPASAEVRARFMQATLVVTHTVFLASDISARAGDRIVVGTRKLLVVEGGYEPPAPGYRQWPAQAHVIEVPQSP